MAWRNARSINTLIAQINAMYPNRSKASDGTIGDAAHQAVASDHNPNAAGVVTAVDITHDPANGLDIAELAQKLVTARDPRIKYIIANRRIWENGTWYPYSGTTDPHTNHLHLSVSADSNKYDDPGLWDLGGKDMITKDSINTLRIGHSEIGGWDLNRTHAGEFDKLFLDAWYGHTVDEFIYTQWVNGQAFRNARVAAFAAAAELAKRPTQEKLDQLNTLLQTCKVESEKVMNDNAILKASAAQDQAVGDGFLRRLGQFLKKYTPGL